MYLCTPPVAAGRIKAVTLRCKLGGKSIITLITRDKSIARAMLEEGQKSACVFVLLRTAGFVTAFIVNGYTRCRNFARAALALALAPAQRVFRPLTLFVALVLLWRNTQAARLARSVSGVIVLLSGRQLLRHSARIGRTPLVRGHGRWG